MNKSVAKGLAIVVLPLFLSLVVKMVSTFAPIPDSSICGSLNKINGSFPCSLLIGFTKTFMRCRKISSYLVASGGKRNAILWNTQLRYHKQLNSFVLRAKTPFGPNLNRRSSLNDTPFSSQYQGIIASMVTYYVFVFHKPRVFRTSIIVFYTK